MERSPALEQPTPAQYALFKAIKMLPIHPLDNQVGLLKLIMEYDRLRTLQIESLQAQVIHLLQMNPAPLYIAQKPKETV